MAAVTKAPTAGDNGTVASIGSNGVKSEAGGGNDVFGVSEATEGIGDEDSCTSEAAGDDNAGSGVDEGIDSKAIGSDVGDSEEIKGSGFISENSLSGCVLTICLDGDLRDLDFFCVLAACF